MLMRFVIAAVALAAMSAAAAAKPVTLSAETNLRAAPGTKSEVVTSIPKGSSVEVGECDAGWCKVTFDGKDGFAIARNLGMVVPGAPRTVTAQGKPKVDLQKLRHGYEGNFGNGPAVTGSADDQYAADIPAAPRAPARRYVERDEQGYYADDDEPVIYGQPRGYIAVAPPPVVYGGYYPYGGPYWRGYGPYWRRW